MIVRPFSHNPTHLIIPGTDNFEDVSIGLSEQEYALNPGGIKWWMGPDESTGYVIGGPVVAENQPTPVGPIGNVQFWRTQSLDTSEFISLANYIKRDNGGAPDLITDSDAEFWLANNGYWTSYFVDGSIGFMTDQSMTAPANSVFDFGTGDFTVEGWVYVNSFSGWPGGLADVVEWNDGAGAYLIIGLTPTGAWRQVAHGAGTQTSIANVTIANAWTHFAMVRNGDTLATYINGVCRMAQTGVSGISMGGSTWPLGINTDPTAFTNRGSLNVSNIRVVTSAVYNYGHTVETSYFTPPTSHLSLIPGTQLLLNTPHDQNYLKDSADHNIIFTIQGLPDSSDYEPFTPYPLPATTTTTTAAPTTTSTTLPPTTTTTTAAPTTTTTTTSGGLVTSGLQFNLQTAPSSGTTWTDASGNGRNATLQGTPTYVSNNGGGIRLNNAAYTGTDYISVPYNIGSSTVTVEIVASFNPTSTWATIWGNDSYSANRGYYAYMPNSTTISWGKPQSTATNTITASNSIRHWVFVINGSSQLLYLNGTQSGTTATIPAQTLFATSEFLFGARHTNGGTGATDKMNNSNSALYPVFYQMRVYNRALSGSEVSTNFNAIKSTYGL
jgi:hypothetical protein